MRRIGVFGAGAWGAALAVTAARAGRETVLWGRRAAGGAAARDVERTSDLRAAARVDAALLAVPAQAVREVAARLAPVLGGGAPVVVCAKGIERDTLMTMSEVATETLPGRPVAVLSGPTFAAEVARGLPSAATLACADGGLAQRLAEALRTPSFRPYHGTDVTGVELGGAVKNVLAVACGITEGRGFGENARAALVTRGVAEMTRLALACGGRAETMTGLAGLGDLTLTCTSRTSRNYAAGVALGGGRPVAPGIVVEGVPTSAALAALARKRGVDMPICRAVDAILNAGADIDTVVAELLARPLRTEA